MSVRLSRRLEQIASYIEKGESVCDIGTDHGYLPIYLAGNGGYGKIIMSDVSKGSLDKAVKDACMSLSEEEMPEARLGDGLDVLSDGEVDDVVIAGMGGLQILDIMSWDISRTLSFRKFILQPRRDAALLRMWLDVNGFALIDQTVVRENGRFSEIICCDTSGASPKDISLHERMSTEELFSEDPERWSEYEYPDELRDPDVSGADTEYFMSEIEKTKAIEKSIRENSASGEKLLRMLEKREERLGKLCRERNS